MTESVLIPDIDNRKITGQVYEIDESIVDTLRHKSKKNGLSENTKSAYKAAVRDFNNFLTAHDYHISPTSLKDYFDTIKGKYRAATLNARKYALLKVLKAVLGENNYLRELAIEKVFEDVDTYQTDVAVDIDDCLTEADVEVIIENAFTQKTKLIIKFLWKTACRVSEMIDIRLSDCERVRGKVKIRVIGKGRKERKVCIPTALFEAVVAEYGGETWLFESKSGRQLNRNNVQIQVKKAARRADFSNITPHKLRHARATDMLLEKDISLKAVSLYLGHASTAITATLYVHDSVDVDALFSKDRV